MGMWINTTGHYIATSCIESFIATQIVANLDNAPTLYQDISRIT